MAVDQSINRSMDQSNGILPRPFSTYFWSLFNPLDLQAPSGDIFLTRDAF